MSRRTFVMHSQFTLLVVSMSPALTCMHLVVELASAGEL